MYDLSVCQMLCIIHRTRPNKIKSNQKKHIVMILIDILLDFLNKQNLLYRWKFVNCGLIHKRKVVTLFKTSSGISTLFAIDVLLMAAFALSCWSFCNSQREDSGTALEKIVI